MKGKVKSKKTTRKYKCGGKVKKAKGGIARGGGAAKRGLRFTKNG